MFYRTAKSQTVASPVVTGEWPGQRSAARTNTEFRVHSWKSRPLIHVPLSVFLLLAAGCATKQPAKKLPQFATVAIVADTQTPLKLTHSSHDQSARRQTKEGFKRGAAAGFSAAVGCGPYIVFCAPLTVLGGAVGAATGGGVGAIEDSLEKLPRAERDLFVDAVRQLNKKQGLALRLGKQLGSALPEGQLADVEDALGLIQVTVREIEFIHRSRKHLALRIHSEISTGEAHGASRKRLRKKSYECRVREMPVQFWHRDLEAQLDQGISVCLKEFTSRIHADVAVYEPRGEIDS